MKKFITVLLVGLLVLVGCSSTDGGSDKEEIKLALIPKAMDSEMWNEVRSGAEKAAEELGVKLTVNAPDTETNVEQQFNIIQDAIASKYDAIIVAPTDSEGVVPILKTALDQDIVVMAVDTDFDLEGKHGFVGTNNLQIGETTAKAMEEMFKDDKDAKLAMITGVPGVQTMRDRADGFKDNLSSNLNLVDEQPADSDSGKALTVMENMLTANNDLKGVFILNATMTAGAVRAVETFKSDVKIVGVDTSQDNIDFVKDDKIAGFVSQDAFGMGYYGVVNAVKAINGETFEEMHYVEAILVTKENVEDFDAKRKENLGG